jgi:hypothetical protein
MFVPVHELSLTKAIMPIQYCPTLAITIGEPAGIGPEIALRAAWALREAVRCVLVGDAALPLIVPQSPLWRCVMPECPSLANNA